MGVVRPQPPGHPLDGVGQSARTVAVRPAGIVHRQPSASRQHQAGQVAHQGRGTVQAPLQGAHRLASMGAHLGALDPGKQRAVAYPQLHALGELCGPAAGHGQHQRLPPPHPHPLDQALAPVRRQGGRPPPLRRPGLRGDLHSFQPLDQPGPGVQPAEGGMPGRPLRIARRHPFRTVAHRSLDPVLGCQQLGDPFPGDRPQRRSPRAPGAGRGGLGGGGHRIAGGQEPGRHPPIPLDGGLAGSRLAHGGQRRPPRLDDLQRLVLHAPRWRRWRHDGRCMSSVGGAGRHGWLRSGAVGPLTLPDRRAATQPRAPRSAGPLRVRPTCPPPAAGGVALRCCQSGAFAPSCPATCAPHSSDALPGPKNGA